MNKEETIFDRLTNGQKISCTAHDEILNGKSPCAIVVNLYNQLAELKAQNKELKEKLDIRATNLELINNERMELQQQLKEKDQQIDYLDGYSHSLITEIDDLKSQLKKQPKQIVKEVKDFFFSQDMQMSVYLGICHFPTFIENLLKKYEEQNNEN